MELPVSARQLWVSIHNSESARVPVEEPVLRHRHFIVAHSDAVSASPMPNLGRKLVLLHVDQIPERDDKEQYADTRKRA